MTTYRVQIRQRMNFLLERATDLSQLLEDACSLGVTIDLRGKHTTYHFGAQQRKTRANKLSDDDRFTKEGLEERITRNKGFVDFLESTIEDCFDQASSFSDFTQLLKQANVTFKRNRQGDVYFRLADFEQGTLSEAAINEGYRMEQIKDCFIYDLPLQRLQKNQTIQEAFASRPQTLPTINETAIQLSTDFVAEQTKDGLLVNVVTPDGEHGQIFVDDNHVEFLPTEKKYLIYLGPQFNYYFQQEGKQSNYFLKGEQLIRQLETMLQVPKVALEIPQTIIQSMNEKGIVLSFEREGIERLFLTNEEISIDPLSQKVTIHLSENWHYSYQRKHGEKKRTLYESLSGKQLIQLIEQNQPMLDTMLKYRLNNYQPKSSVLESKELANQLNLLRNDRIKDIPILLKQMVRLETQIQQTMQSLDSLKDKISEYNQVAKHLVAYQNYSWTKEDSSNQYKQEKTQFQTAEKFLADKSINPMVSSEKVITLIRSHQQEEKHLNERIKQLGIKLKDYQKINQLLDELNEPSSSQQKKKKEKERQLD